MQDAAEAPVEGLGVPEGGLIFHHAILNLPATAVEFLDVFNGCFNQQRWKDVPLPHVHCYTFAKNAETDAGSAPSLVLHLALAVLFMCACIAADKMHTMDTQSLRVFSAIFIRAGCLCLLTAAGCVADIKARAETALGGALTSGCQVHLVRDVAPNKRMFCLSFQVPEAIAFGQGAPTAAAATEADDNICNGVNGHHNKKQKTAEVC